MKFFDKQKVANCVRPTLLIRCGDLLFYKNMLVYENRASKVKFFWCQGIFSLILISKIGVKMNLRIITKFHAADSKIWFLTKSILKPFGRETAMPPAWELNNSR